MTTSVPCSSAIPNMKLVLHPPAIFQAPSLQIQGQNVFNLWSEWRDLGRHMDRMFVLFVVGEMDVNLNPGPKRKWIVFPKKNDIS